MVSSKMPVICDLHITVIALLNCFHVIDNQFPIDVSSFAVFRLSLCDPLFGRLLMPTGRGGINGQKRFAYVSTGDRKFIIQTDYGSPMVNCCRVSDQNYNIHLVHITLLI